MARRQLEVSNEVAAELAGSRDAALRTLEEQLDCEVFLRGNIVTLDGEAEAVQAGATVGGGGRAARLPPGRPDGEGGPVPAPTVRRAQRHDGPGEGRLAPGEGRH